MDSDSCPHCGNPKADALTHYQWHMKKAGDILKNAPEQEQPKTNSATIRRNPNAPKNPGPTKTEFGDFSPGSSDLIFLPLV